MSLKGNRRAPKHTERSACAKAGSPKRGNSHGDGILIVAGEECNGASSSEGVNPRRRVRAPHDTGVQERY